MAAAVVARRHGLSVAVIDEQLTPGGQIWRSIERASRRDAILGRAYVDGREAAADFRSCGACYFPGTRLWQVEDHFRAFVSEGNKAWSLEGKTLLLASGAQERPVPFPGWTLPGVLTVGAAQILLKSAGQVPDAPVWIAGTGPLPLLYAIQLLEAGGEIAGFLDTTPKGQWTTAIRHLPRALFAVTDLLKGLGWQSKLRLSRAPVIRNVVSIEAQGDDRLQRLSYQTASGQTVTADASLLLVHEGVVPNIHPALSLGVDVTWSEAQDCFTPVLDEWGETSRSGVFVAGDAAGIGGAKAAQSRGKLAALAVVERCGGLSSSRVDALASPIRRKLRQELAVRPFLDATFKPRPSVFAPTDETIVCRCEGVSAGEIRAIAQAADIGPNQVKAATRAGMGPCQGRQCGYTVTRLVGATQGRSSADVGFLHIRPPLKPITLAELATVNESK